MIELNLTEDEFDLLFDMFKSEESVILREAKTDTLKELVNGIRKSFETAGKPVLQTTENKPRVKE